MVAMVLVTATADIGAYFAGRRFGKHKLAMCWSARPRPGRVSGEAWLPVQLLAVVLWSLLPGHAGQIGLASVVVVTADDRTRLSDW